MGALRSEIELINAEDIAYARKNFIGEEEIKRITITALIDTGCHYLAINENIQSILQLPVIGRQQARLANGTIIDCDVVDSVKLRLKNRETTCPAMVLPGDVEVLVGVVPLEALCFLIDPVRQELIDDLPIRV